MGMYTELICGCTLRKDTPKIFVDSMFWLLNNTQGKEPPEITKFIDNYDLSRILFSDSYYFGAPSNCIFKYDKIGDNYELSIRSNLKNYEGQIEKFLDYITPYVEDGSGTKNIFAMVLYEENEFPTLYTIDGKYEFNDKKLEAKYNKDINDVIDILTEYYKIFASDYTITTKDLKKINIKNFESYKLKDCFRACLNYLKEKYKDKNLTYHQGYKDAYINAINHLEDYSKSDISEEKKEILNNIIDLWKRDLVTD